LASSFFVTRLKVEVDKRIEKPIEKPNASNGKLDHTSEARGEAWSSAPFSLSTARCSWTRKARYSDFTVPHPTNVKYLKAILQASI
jgi:hypothetical protein